MFAGRKVSCPHGGWLHSGTAEDSDRTCMTRACQLQPAICAKLWQSEARRLADLPAQGRRLPTVLAALKPACCQVMTQPSQVQPLHATTAPAAARQLLQTPPLQQGLQPPTDSTVKLMSVKDHLLERCTSSRLKLAGIPTGMQKEFHQGAEWADTTKRAEFCSATSNEMHEPLPNTQNLLLCMPGHAVWRCFVPYKSETGRALPHAAAHTLVGEQSAPATTWSHLQ